MGIRWLSAESVSVLGQHHRDTSSGHQVPHPVHARTLKARSALTGVRDLCEDLVLLAGRSRTWRISSATSSFTSDTSRAGFLAFAALLALLFRASLRLVSCAGQ